MMLAIGVSCLQGPVGPHILSHNRGPAGSGLPDRGRGGRRDAHSKSEIDFRNLKRRAFEIGGFLEAQPKFAYFELWEFLDTSAASWEIRVFRKRPRRCPQT